MHWILLLDTSAVGFHEILRSHSIFLKVIGVFEAQNLIHFWLFFQVKSVFVLIGVLHRRARLGAESLLKIIKVTLDKFYFIFVQFLSDVCLLHSDTFLQIQEFVFFIFCNCRTNWMLDMKVRLHRILLWEFRLIWPHFGAFAIVKLLLCKDDFSCFVSYGLATRSNSQTVRHKAFWHSCNLLWSSHYIFLSYYLGASLLHLGSCYSVSAQFLNFLLRASWGRLFVRNSWQLFVWCALFHQEPWTCRLDQPYVFLVASHSHCGLLYALGHCLWVVSGLLHFKLFLRVASLFLIHIWNYNFYQNTE